jgi:MFS family permease
VCRGPGGCAWRARDSVPSRYLRPGSALRAVYAPEGTQLPGAGMRDEPTGPFPYYTTAVCCLGMFGCAFNMTVVFPFIPRLVEDLGMVEDPRKPGYFAGYLTSAQQLGRVVTSIAWGWAADRYGRKPVATISVVMTGITALAFGFCEVYWLAVGIRLLNGLCDFMLGTAKMMLTELIEPYHQPRAMSYLGACWGIAVIVGPTFGGLLARPADKYPEWIAADSLLGRYPYALPNLVTAGLCSIGALLLQTLPESLPGGAKPMCGGGKGQQPEIPAESNDSDSETESLLSDVVNSGVNSKSAPQTTVSNKCQFCLDEKPKLSISFYTVAMFVEFFDPMLLSLWASAPVSAGGLGYNTSQIGSVLAVTGGSLIVFQVLIYPSANRMYGTLGLLRRLVCLQLPFWCAIPLATASRFPLSADPAIQYDVQVLSLAALYAHCTNARSDA